MCVCVHACMCVCVCVCVCVPAGVKFIIVADPWQQKVEELIKKIYENYSDYVLKNPFYSLDMPIRCVCIR